MYLFDNLIKSNKAQVLSVCLLQPAPFDPVIGYSVELFVSSEVRNVIGPPGLLFAELSSTSNLPKGNPLHSSLVFQSTYVSHPVPF